MDSSYEGFVRDPFKCSLLSLEEKRDLVHEISKRSSEAPEILQSWSRRELLLILCAEMGKERKYTGLPKSKIIEQLLRIITENNSTKRTAWTNPEPQPSPPTNQNAPKRQRKTDNPSRLPAATAHLNRNISEDSVSTKSCRNLACRAVLQRDDLFCKRCSCCICYQYDDNKDPSLWLVCSSEPPCEGDSCGMSCHLECAIKHERTGIAEVRLQKKLEGCFYCVSCGKVNDLLRCCRKQLMTAKDTRRVDVLCYRISLCLKLLDGTQKYRKVNEIVEMAAKMLEAEVGPMAGLPTKMARGIVNRLSSGPGVQRLCASAIESLDSTTLSSSILPIHNPRTHGEIKFISLSPTSLMLDLASEDLSPKEHVEYMVWLRKVDVADYPANPARTFLTPETKLFLSDLAPATEYLFKVVSVQGSKELIWEAKFTTSDDMVKNPVPERGQSPTTNSSSISNPSDGDETTNIATDNPTGIVGQEGILGDSVSILEEERVLGEVGFGQSSTIPMESQRGFVMGVGNPVPDMKPDHSPECSLSEKMIVDDNRSNGGTGPIETQIVPFVNGSSNASLPITPDKPETQLDGLGKNRRPELSNEEQGNNGFKEMQAGSSSRRRIGAPWKDNYCMKNGSFDGGYEYCVKTIRRLECEGHIEQNFRVKFLTWYSLRASPEERRIVKVFVDTFLDDPVCLAGQLIDTFSEVMSTPKPHGMPAGFCTRLWH